MREQPLLGALGGSVLYQILKTTALIVLIAPHICAQEPANPQSALAEARALAENRDFQAVFDTLQPFLQDTFDTELSWEIAAELGRAAFYTARYQQGLVILRKVVAARPVVLEPALYLGATSYILGDHPQALAVLEAVLQSGTIDLYRTVTLPGERSFLADPEVREILDRYSKPLLINPQQGTCMGLPLGLPRTEVVERLGADSINAGSIAARAGPRLIWVWTFDENNVLSEVVLHTQNLWRYTPYRVHIGDAVSWDATPADVLGAYGPPERTIPGKDNSLVLGWNTEKASLDFVFSQEKGEGETPGRLEIVRLFSRPQEATPTP